MQDEIYADLIQRKGGAYRAEQVAQDSHYLDPIERREGRLAGNSRIWGDASAEVQSRVIDHLLDASRDAGLGARDTAHVLAIARIESGFNPDAAAGTTSASGLGQFVRDTGIAYGLTDQNRFDVQSQARALVAHYLDNRELATRRGQDEAYIYKYHHDGPSLDFGGLALSEDKVMPLLDGYTRFVEARFVLEQGGDRAPDHGGGVPGAVAETFDDVIQAELPRQSDVVRHADGEHGEQRRMGTHDLAPAQSTAAHGHLRENDRGEDVRALQSTLIELGFGDAHGVPLQSDGVFGPRTGEAVRALQRAHGLEADGIVGPDTRAAMDRALPLERAASLAGEGVDGSPAAPLEALLAAARTGDQAALREALSDLSKSAIGQVFHAAASAPPTREERALAAPLQQDGMQR
ncbi:peptidoglycan-binding protein [Coralloluteibacterium stylophorae]|uniref:Peptidoglycan-binding protein n=1 Tax=Coralloluteibacterium stylophorae TaxID=1776034 RepID=A0AAP2FY17_9GAMM|nr:peptidoglycan-binding protein [Coralloluteibacterium stylophorae]MBS7456647.1 peptidoglycan-binding protein [Coralloluteibacterium stylophorae]